MRTILEKPTRSGKRRVVLELDQGEQLIAIKPDSFYKLAYPLDDQVLASHIVDSMTRVVWDSLEQKWI